MAYLDEMLLADRLSEEGLEEEFEPKIEKKDGEEGGFRNPYVSAFMPFANYLRRMILPLQSGTMPISSPAKVYNPVEVKSMEYRGLTGVAANEDEDSAIYDAYNLGSKRGAADWLEIEIPAKEMFIDLEKDIDDQSDYVRLNILGRRPIEVLFIDESRTMDKKIEDYVQSYPPQEKRARASFELKNFYELKRKEILRLKSARAYIEYLNERGSTHDCNMTTSYLYNICGIKGLIYGDAESKRILLFNARSDITVTNWKRAPI